MTVLKCLHTNLFLYETVICVMNTFTPGSFSWEGTNTCTRAAHTVNHLCAVDSSLSSVTVASVDLPQAENMQVLGDV